MINKTILVGRLTADPELRQTQSGISVTSFTVACNRPYKNGREQQADFINCVAWRKTAEFASNYFTKGNAIGVEGSIQTRKYADKNGNNRVAFEVVVDKVSFVESKKESNIPKPKGDSQNGSFDDFQDLETDDDLPF